MMGTLYLFTDNFPYGKGEAFIEDEISVFSTKFDHIYIFPLHKIEGNRPLPANVSVVDLFQNETYNGKKTVWKYKWLYLSILLNEFLHVHYKWNFIKNFREHSGILLKAFYRAGLLDEMIDRSTQNMYLSFWFYEWATILGILRRRKRIANFFSRAHSFDIYGEYFRKDKIIPFRHFQFRQVQVVFPDSMEGLRALKKQAGVHSHKVEIGYLGGRDYGMNAYVNDNTVKIISCAFVIPRKRVWLIVEALKQVTVNVNWLHIGDGPDLKELIHSTKALPENIVCEFVGYKEKAALLEYYKKQAFDVMLHVSEKEGLPTAMIDAASFGVPIIATDAGGTKELVNDRTGILLPVDVKADTIAAIINDFKNSKLNSPDFRKQVKAAWNEQFNAETNYNRMLEKFTAGS